MVRAGQAGLALRAQGPAVRSPLPMPWQGACRLRCAYDPELCAAVQLPLSAAPAVSAPGGCQVAAAPTRRAARPGGGPDALQRAPHGARQRLGRPPVHRALPHRCDRLVSPPQPPCRLVHAPPARAAGDGSGLRAARRYALFGDDVQADVLVDLTLSHVRSLVPPPRAPCPARRLRAPATRDAFLRPCFARRIRAPALPDASAPLPCEAWPRAVRERRRRARRWAPARARCCTRSCASASCSASSASSRCRCGRCARRCAACSSGGSWTARNPDPNPNPNFKQCSPGQSGLAAPGAMRMHSGADAPRAAQAGASTR